MSGELNCEFKAESLGQYVHQLFERTSDKFFQNLNMVQLIPSQKEGNLHEADKEFEILLSRTR